MGRKRASIRGPDQPNKPEHNSVYEIRVAGRLDPGWSEWLPGMQIFPKDAGPCAPETVLRGAVPDQSALRGILCRLWDLGLTVIHVERFPTGKDKRSEPS